MVTRKGNTSVSYTYEKITSLILREILTKTTSGYQRGPTSPFLPLCALRAGIYILPPHSNWADSIHFPTLEARAFTKEGQAAPGEAESKEALTQI